MPESGSSRYHIAAIIAAVFMAYANTLFNGFNFDTPSVLIYNPAVHGLSIKNILAVFTSVPNSVEYLPVRDLTYMLDYSLWGLSPQGYHLSNIIYYAAACVCVYYFLLSLFGGLSSRPRMAALIATLVFALHPIHTESVAGIAQRKDILSGLFFFLSLFCYMSYRGTARVSLLVASLAAFVLAMLSKGTAVVLPLVIMLIEVRGGLSRRKVLDVSIYFLIALGMTVMFMLIAEGAGLITSSAGGPLMRIPTALRAAVYNMKMLIMPYPLLISHEFLPSSTFIGVPEVLSALVMLVLGRLLYIFRQRHWPVVLSILFSLALMLPVVGLIPTSTVIAERYMFLPALGPAMLIGFWGVLVYEKRGRAWFTVSLSIILALFFSLTFMRTYDWRTNESLLMADLRHSPDSFKINQTLGRYHFVNKRYDLAFGYLQKLKSIRPSSMEYDFHLSMYHHYNGDNDSALRTLEQSGLARAGYVDAYVLMGMIHKASGRPERAAMAFRSALSAERIMGIFFKTQAERELAAMRREGR